MSAKEMINTKLNIKIPKNNTYAPCVEGYMSNKEIEKIWHYIDE